MCGGDVKKMVNDPFSKDTFRKMQAVNWTLMVGGADPLLGAQVGAGIYFGGRDKALDRFDQAVPQWRQNMQWADPGGFYNNPKAVAREIAAKERQAMFLAETMKGPAAPEKSAMEIYDAEGVRNRRRAAALMGINQLRTPSGPGTASGGAYSGVSGGLY